MSKIRTTTWPIEPHTEAKHAILKKYLNAWVPIMARYNGRVLYIDGFAGPGEYEGGEPGSPIIAINAVLGQRISIKSEIIMFFIEENEDRCAHLNQKISTFNIPQNINLKPKVVCGKFDETLSNIFKFLEEQKKSIAPSFIFIDPFGFNMPFSVIKKIMSNGKCEVLINFMYEKINRFIGDKKLEKHYIELFGTDKWKTATTENDPKKRIEILHSVYLEQLKNEAGIKFVHSFKMINKVNKTYYFLFFGTNNLLGIEKMKEAMWSVDKTGNFQFSDATYNCSQMTLFDNDPNYQGLKKNILDTFQGQTISFSQLGDFTISETPFLKKHSREVLRRMEKTIPSGIEVTDRKRKGTYPSDCLIKFL
ncbi:MAG TPA: three-Cys-motif partner protein TcmP [Candidatus Paceibacterota bacterium]|nr:three-Cys-motif partner protein TcmP [Candidatus Magasanikbacteria bacterium]HPW34770.1 three-Cys-motif partner protein TcmP [Candidatus Paceibacterota bacterium]